MYLDLTILLYIIWNDNRPAFKKTIVTTYFVVLFLCPDDGILYVVGILEFLIVTQFARLPQQDEMKP